MFPTARLSFRADLSVSAVRRKRGNKRWLPCVIVRWHRALDIHVRVRGGPVYMAYNPENSAFCNVAEQEQSVFAASL